MKEVTKKFIKQNLDYWITEHYDDLTTIGDTLEDRLKRLQELREVAEEAELDTEGAIERNVQELEERCKREEQSFRELEEKYKRKG